MSDITEAIRKQLIADETLMALVSGVYDEIAPEGVDYPFIVVGAQSPALAQYTLGDGVPFLESSIVKVKAIDQNLSSAVAEDVAARIKVVLQDAALAIAGKVPLWCRWESEIDYTTHEDGLTFRHKGTNWRVEASS